MSAAYSWGEGSVEGVTGDPVAGNRTEGAEGGIRASGPGPGVLVVKTALEDERWTTWEQSFSCRNPTQDSLV